jgi:hypothetical protein
VDSADLFTLVSSGAWVLGLAFGYLLGYIAGQARSRRRAGSSTTPTTRRDIRRAVTVPLPPMVPRR